jgi:hypothetical protein
MDPTTPILKPYKPHSRKVSYDRKKYIQEREAKRVAARKKREAASLATLRTTLQDDEQYYRELRAFIVDEERTLHVALEQHKMTSLLDCIDAGKILCAMREAAPGLGECECEELCIRLKEVALENETCQCSEWCRAVGGKSPT